MYEKNKLKFLEQIFSLPEYEQNRIFSFFYQYIEIRNLKLQLSTENSVEDTSIDIDGFLKDFKRLNFE